MADRRWLTIAIPTLNRWKFLQESLPTFLDRPEVAQVIICDENGDDSRECMNSPFAQHPRLRIVVNERVLGIYENKRKCISLSETNWVAVLDSDNFFSDEWFDTLTDVININDLSRVYASAEAKHVNSKDGSVKEYTKEFSGLELNYKVWNSIFEKPKWNFLLNEGNWVVPKRVLEVLPVSAKSSDLMAADAIFMLRSFVAGGYTVHYVPGLTYLHTVHNESSWLKTERESTRILNQTCWFI